MSWTLATVYVTMKWTKPNDDEPLQVICGVQKTNPGSKKLTEYFSLMLWGSSPRNQYNVLMTTFLLPLPHHAHLLKILPMGWRTTNQKLYLQQNVRNTCQECVWSTYTYDTAAHLKLSYTVWGVEVQLHAFSTWALVKGKWLTSSLTYFTPKERGHGTHKIWGWVDRRASLDAVEERKISQPHQESNSDSSAVQPIASHCTEWAIQAPSMYTRKGQRKRKKQMRYRSSASNVPFHKGNCFHIYHTKKEYWSIRLTNYAIINMLLYTIVGLWFYKLLTVAIVFLAFLNLTAIN
jgi:hypothetical protein